MTDHATDNRIDEFWIADEPIRYLVRHRDGNDFVGAGVHIIRWEGSDENCGQALMEITYDGGTVRLRQYDGDLDAAKVIDQDQELLRSYRRYRPNIWRRIWKVAMA